MVVLDVQRIRLIHPDVPYPCPDGRVFAISYVALVRTSLKLRSDDEPCRVISHSPRAAAASYHFFLASFVFLCVFSVLFMHISHVHVSSLQFISTPGMFLYSFTDLFLVFMLKIVWFWVSLILSLICIIAQNSLLIGMRFCIFGILLLFGLSFM